MIYPSYRVYTLFPYIKAVYILTRTKGLKIAARSIKGNHNITGIHAKEGDEVIIFGKTNSVAEIAENLDTIPYELLATLNRRIKRVYH